MQPLTERSTYREIKQLAELSCKPGWFTTHVEDDYTGIIAQGMVSRLVVFGPCLYETKEVSEVTGTSYDFHLVRYFLSVIEAIFLCGPGCLAYDIPDSRISVFLKIVGGWVVSLV